MTEVWGDIKGYIGYYQISTLGSVKSLSRIVKRSSGDLLIKECILIQYVNSLGYKTVTLYKDKSKATKTVHRLVAIAFIENKHIKPHVNHIDGIKINNNVLNLEWCTPSENIRHAYKLGLSSRKGESNNMYGVTGADNMTSKAVVQYDSSMNMINEYDSIRIAEKNTGVSNQNISKVCKGIRPKAGGYIWMYKTQVNKYKTLIL